MTPGTKALYKAVINRYIKKNPDEWAMFLEGNENRRKELADPEYGMLSTGVHRLAASVPEKLDKQLKVATMSVNGSNDYMSKEFFKEFPMFVIPKKI